MVDSEQISSTRKPDEHIILGAKHGCRPDDGGFREQLFRNVFCLSLTGDQYVLCPGRSSVP